MSRSLEPRRLCSVVRHIRHCDRELYSGTVSTVDTATVRSPGYKTLRELHALAGFRRPQNHLFRSNSNHAYHQAFEPKRLGHEGFFIRHHSNALDVKNLWDVLDASSGSESASVQRLGVGSDTTKSIGRKDV